MILALSAASLVLALGASAAFAQADTTDPPPSEEELFATGIHGHPTQREAWDRMMAGTWQVSKLANKTRLEPSLTGELRPYLLGKMIDQNSGDKGMVFIADWRGQSPALSQELDRLGYFEVARQATSYYDMSLIYLVVDDRWAKETSSADNKRLSALIQRVITREDLTHELLIEELGKLAASSAELRWEIKQVDFSQGTALFSMRLVQRRQWRAPRYEDGARARASTEARGEDRRARSKAARAARREHRLGPLVGRLDRAHAQETRAAQVGGRAR